ncbi:hypothetical protein QYE76_038000 [Lolium multiflorum]|uniref:DUF8039 domain-containing protein n=1 Tax=Lolium multiflorum TaxID=4521 RepID=A0AAD8T887_LOLMU|nr:hypothetical protein QYE76_038000 [Lolium multiflorum]
MRDAQEGKIKFNRDNDALTKALGNPEHGGRVRGKGAIPWSVGFSQDDDPYGYRSPIGTALPCTPGALHHNNPIEDGYARVTVEDIVQGFEDLEIDIATPEGAKRLGDVKRQFILWKKKFIKFPGEAPRSTSPPPSGGGGGGGSPTPPSRHDAAPIHLRRVATPPPVPRRTTKAGAITEASPPRPWELSEDENKLVAAAQYEKWKADCKKKEESPSQQALILKEKKALEEAEKEESKRETSCPARGTKYVFILNGAAVSWIKQSVVAKSSTESEYIAASEASSEAIWMKRFITELGVVPSALDPLTIYCDNMGAIANAQEPRSHKKLKHINLRFHVIRETRDCPGVISIDITAIFIAVAVSYDEEGVVLPG